MAETSIQIVGRIADLLESVAAKGSAGLRLSEVVEVTGLGKTTVHRLLNALVDIGYLSHDPSTRAFSIGPTIGRLAAMGHERDLASIAAPFMRDIARETQDTVFLSVRDGSEAVCLAREVGRFPIRTLTLDPGDRRPLGVGAGSAALFAAVDDYEASAVVEDLEALLKPYPNFDGPRLLKERKANQQRGHSLNEEGVLEGMSAIGVSLHDGRGRTIGAISVAAIATRMKPARRKIIASQLTDVAAAIRAIYTQSTAETSSDTLSDGSESASIMGEEAA